MKIEVPIDELQELLQNGVQVLDGIHGGLVIGKSHANGGVKVLREENDIYYTGEVTFEGGEYLINPWATQKYIDRLNNINGYKGLFKDLNENNIASLNRVLPIVDDFSMILISNWPQMIINKVATSAFLKELDEINKYGTE